MTLRSVLRYVGLAGILTTAACAATSSIVQNRAAVEPNVMATCPIFVMWPTPAPAAFQGNVGVSAFDIESIVANRILEVVRERCPNGELVRPALPTPSRAIPGYAAALAGTGVTALEQSAAAFAQERGAKYLLVPAIQRWNQRRTDDPVGALITPKNSIDVSVRLMRLESPAVVGRVTFTNRSRIVLNQAAARLLNHDFDAALRALLEGTSKGK